MTEYMHILVRHRLLHFFKCIYFYLFQNEFTQLTDIYNAKRKTAICAVRIGRVKSLEMHSMHNLHYRKILQ